MKFAPNARALIYSPNSVNNIRMSPSQHAGDIKVSVPRHNSQRLGAKLKAEVKKIARSQGQRADVNQTSYDLALAQAMVDIDGSLRFQEGGLILLGLSGKCFRLELASYDRPCGARATVGCWYTAVSHFELLCILGRKDILHICQIALSVE